jgi:hypothetical protein
VTFADIASGEAATADVLFLIAAIVFGVAALIEVPQPPPAVARWSHFLLGAGLCLVAVAWLIL